MVSVPETVPPRSLQSVAKLNATPERLPSHAHARDPLYDSVLLVCCTALPFVSTEEMGRGKTCPEEEVYCTCQGFVASCAQEVLQGQ